MLVTLNGVSGNGLTLSHTIPTFNDPEKKAFRKYCGKRRKCWLPAFSPFPTMFSTHPKKNVWCEVTIILSSENAFNFDRSRNLTFGKELMACRIHMETHLSQLRRFNN